MRTFGLIGHPIGHSFSPNYFKSKFEREGISDASYQLFPLPDINGLPKFVALIENLVGLNVTIPHKTNVLPFLNFLGPVASRVRAVNTIRINRDSKDQLVLEGFNTDVGGFTASLIPLLRPQHTKAIVLGTGGASLAILEGLKELEIETLQVSRNPELGQTSYQELDKSILQEFPLIINTTPLGFYPSTTFPLLPYQGIGKHHLLFDLVYNPIQTPFLQKGLAAGAQIKNGLEMLERQADLSWEIWND